MATTHEAKPKGAALIDGIKSSSWQSRVAAAIVAALVVLLLVQAVKDPGQFVSQLLIGTTNGAIIALIALGYTLVYGIVELINFAHGDNFMIGSFVGVTVLSGTILGLGSFQISFPSLISNSNALAGITDAVAYRWKDLFVVLVTIPLLLGLSYFIRSTRQGKAMRAVAQDKEAAAMMGINVNRTISVAFLLGGILAGASGVMFGLFNGTTVFDVGFRQGLFAFTAAVLGGIGNLAGAVVGGVLIGVIGSMSDQYVGVRWTDIVIFTVLILVLVFRPRGLLGDRSAVQGGGGE